MLHYAGCLLISTHTYPLKEKKYSNHTINLDKLSERTQRSASIADKTPLQEEKKSINR